MELIGFPNLGIWLRHVGTGIHIFGFEIAFYGICVVLGMAAGVWLSARLAEKTGQDPDLYMDFALIALVVSVLGARVYYVIFSWDYYRAHLLEIFNLRGGGLAIYGGIIGGVLTAVIYARVKKADLALMVDTAAAGLALGQCIGRWGNFFNREAFGAYTRAVTAMALPLEAVDPGTVTEEMLAHTEVFEGVTCILVHPTFLYESLWSALIVIILLVLTLRCRKRVNGEWFAVYLLLYAAGRFFIEGLRTDQLLLPGSQIPVSQLLSAVFAIGAAGFIVWARLRGRGKTGNEQN